jgi:monodictyphenone polyketide synthase
VLSSWEPLSGKCDKILTAANTNDIRYYETSPNEYAFDSAHTYLTGLGLGLLASTAASLSPTLADLPLAGAEVVRVAFRLGVLVADVSQNLQPTDETGNRGSWAYVIPNVALKEAEEELTAIHTREVSSTRVLPYLPANGRRILQRLAGSSSAQSVGRQ